MASPDVEAIFKESYLPPWLRPKIIPVRSENDFECFVQVKVWRRGRWSDEQSKRTRGWQWNKTTMIDQGLISPPDDPSIPWKPVPYLYEE